MLEYLLPIKNYDLLKQLTRREILQRFHSSWLGLGWAIITPLAMLAVYTFVFRSVLKAKWPGAENSDSEFALQVFSGLLIFTLFSEVVGRAPNLIIEQPNLVKKVIFPLEILPWMTVIAALFYSIISLSVLFLGTWLMRGVVSVHFISVPFILAAFLPMLLGLSWFLSALGIYVRDIHTIIGLILTPLLFLSPIFYPASALPEKFQFLMSFNPLTFIIESIRGAILGNNWPDIPYLAGYFFVSLLVSCLGASFFHYTRKGFSDVI
jgi:lipopolysaccharide transport system permease protein